VILNIVYSVIATCSPDATSPILPPKNIIRSLAAEVEGDLAPTTAEPQNSDTSYYAAVESHNPMNLSGLHSSTVTVI
jgi:hypothetical protein